MGSTFKSKNLEVRVGDKGNFKDGLVIIVVGVGKITDSSFVLLFRIIEKIKTTIKTKIKNIILIKRKILFLDIFFYLHCKYLSAATQPDESNPHPPLIPICT